MSCKSSRSRSSRSCCGSIVGIEGSKGLAAGAGTYDVAKIRYSV